MAKVLILLDHPAAYREFRPIACSLVERGQIVSFFVDDPSLNTAIPPGDRAIFDFSGARMQPPRSPATTKQSVRRDRAFLRSPLGTAAVFASTIWHYVRGRLRYARALSHIAPHAVIVGGDRRFPTEIAFLAATRSRNIYSLIVPYADAEFEDIAFNRHQDDGLVVERKSLRALKGFVARRFPRQTYRSRFGGVLFYHPAMTLALRLLGVLPKQPWVLGGSGLSSHTAVAARTDRSLFTELGLDPEQTSLTGRASFDEIFDQLQKRGEIRAALEARYGFTPTRKLVIASLAQRFAEYDCWREADYCSFIEVLNGSGANVLLSIHPKESRATYPFIEETPNMRFMREPLIKGLASADVFAAPLSSTLRWAMLLGIPCLAVEPIVDALPPHNQFPFAPLSRTMPEFRQRLHALLTDSTQYENAKKTLDSVREQDIPFDGLATMRIVNLVPLDVPSGA